MLRILFPNSRYAQNVLGVTPISYEVSHLVKPVKSLMFWKHDPSTCESSWNKPLRIYWHAVDNDERSLSSKKKEIASKSGPVRGTLWSLDCPEHPAEELLSQSWENLPKLVLLADFLLLTHYHEVNSHIMWSPDWKVAFWVYQDFVSK